MIHHAASVVEALGVALLRVTDGVLNKARIRAVYHCKIKPTRCLMSDRGSWVWWGGGRGRASGVGVGEGVGAGGGLTVGSGRDGEINGRKFKSKTAPEHLEY